MKIFVALYFFVLYHYKDFPCNYWEFKDSTCLSAISDIKFIFPVSSTLLGRSSRIITLVSSSTLCEYALGPNIGLKMPLGVRSPSAQILAPQTEWWTLVKAGGASFTLFPPNHPRPPEWPHRQTLLSHRLVLHPAEILKKRSRTFYMFQVFCAVLFRPADSSGRNLPYFY